MKKWLSNLRKDKKVFPILSFPAVQLLNCSVKDLLFDSHLQAKAMKMVAEKCHLPAGIGLMDLSIEAECFGANIRYENDDIPSVIGALVEDDANELCVPDVYSKRAKIYIDAIEEAVSIIKDKPVFPGMIGPYSLAGRLLDVSEALALCYEDPDLVHAVLEKATQFLINYGKVFKSVGAKGVIMAEPLAGILSPNLVKEFSCDYVKRIVGELQDDDFIVIYHNCGNNTVKMINSLLEIGCPIYHFGNAIDMKDMVQKVPEDIIVMGNIDPAGILRDGTVNDVQKAVIDLMENCGEYNHFILSSGCDIPWSTPWENIKCFIDTGNSYYEK